MAASDRRAGRARTLLAAAALAAAWLARPAPASDLPLVGRYTRARAHPGWSAEQAELAAHLEALGYAQGVAPARATTGVVLHDATRAQPGRNLVVDGHAAAAELVDMDGRVLHRWSRPIEDVFPEDAARTPEHSTHWRRARVLANGDLFAIYEGIGVVALDRDSNVRWRRRNGAHHDLRVAPDGSVLVLTREARIVLDVDPDRPVLDESVERLDARGELVAQTSIFESFARSSWADVLAYRERGDILHTNALVPLDGALERANPAFAAGRWLLSLRNASALAVLDPSQERVVWLAKGDWTGQHDPSALPDGRLLLFDNGSTGVRHETDGRSRILAVDPATADAEVVYEGGDAAPFFSATCGAVARLANGDTLVTETDAGRAFELAPDGAIVWEYYTPHRAGEDGEYIATLFEVQRLPEGFGDAWLARAREPVPGVRPPPVPGRPAWKRFVAPGLGALAAALLVPALFFLLGRARR
ncbi:MAG: hypothetical protein KC560_01665 [Myxococcales bacterium]|nr:hypothetical protein [Myxococcales bacterium]